MPLILTSQYLWYAGSRDGVPVAFAAKTLGFFGDDACDAFEAYACTLHEGAEPTGVFTRPVAFGVASDGATRGLPEGLPECGITGVKYKGAVRRRFHPKPLAG